MGDPDNSPNALVVKIVQQTLMREKYHLIDLPIVRMSKSCGNSKKR
jgi:hypothetical protein